MSDIEIVYIFYFVDFKFNPQRIGQKNNVEY
jgi:hypothetical protein